MKKFFRSAVSTLRGAGSRALAFALVAAGALGLTQASPAQAVVTLPAGVTTAIADITETVTLMFAAIWPVIALFTVGIITIAIFKKLRGKAL